MLEDMLTHRERVFFPSRGPERFSLHIPSEVRWKISAVFYANTDETKWLYLAYR